MAFVGAETAFQDGRRAGCSTMIVTEDEVSIVCSLRRWPDDQSEEQLRWHLIDGRNLTAFTTSGGAYGGGIRAGKLRNLDGSWRFSGSASGSVKLICSMADREIMNLDVPLISAPTSPHRLVIRSAQHRPPASERNLFRELFVQIRSHWPAERAAADRVELPSSSVDLSGHGIEIIAIEHWAGVRALLARFPSAGWHTRAENPPVWWQVEIDGIGTHAVLLTSATGATGLLARLVLADDRSPGVPTDEPAR